MDSESGSKSSSAQKSATPNESAASHLPQMQGGAMQAEATCEPVEWLHRMWDVTKDLGCVLRRSHKDPIHPGCFELVQAFANGWQCICGVWFPTKSKAAQCCFDHACTKANMLMEAATHQLTSGRPGLWLLPGTECGVCGSKDGGWQCNDASSHLSHCAACRFSKNGTISDVEENKPFCVHGGTSSPTRRGELQRVLAHLKDHQDFTKEFTRSMDLVLKGLQKLGVLQPQCHEPPATHSVPSSMHGRVEALRKLHARGDMAELCNQLAFLNVSKPADQTSDTAEITHAVSSVQLGAFYQVAPHEAVCVLSSWETRRGSRAYLVIHLVPIRRCKRHGNHDESRPCWQFKSNSRCVLSEPDILTAGVRKVQFTPGLQCASDTKRDPSGACFVLVPALSHSSPCSHGTSLAAAQLRNLIQHGAFYGFTEAQALLKVFPRKLLWYRHPDGSVVQPRDCRCPESGCGRYLELKDVEPWSHYGVGAESLFLPFVPRLRCSRSEVSTCSFSCTAAQEDFKKVLPPDCVPMFSWDRVGDRIFEQAAVNFLCSEYRVRFSQAALRLSLARRMVAALLLAWPHTMSHVFWRHW